MGVLIDGARDPGREGRLNGAFALAGASLAVGGYLASYLPSIYARSNFWTSSPTFFVLRTGLIMMATATVFLWERGRDRAGGEVAGRRAWSPMQEFGRASLFVYWIHVEMVYGVLTRPLHKRLPIGWAFAAFALFSLFLFGIAMSKNALVLRWRERRARAAAPSAVP